MRVLLALDGSPASDAARRLVASLPWPEGTMLHVVGAVEPVVDSFAGVSGYPGMSVDVEPPFESSLSAILDEACTSLEAPGRIVRRSVHVGRPGSVIVDEAAAMRAELIIVGSRGLGPMKSMVLGSVSAEVVDHAPCPVLVVRRPQVSTVLFATDGSASARGALTFLASLHYLADRPIEVISVGARASSIPTLVMGTGPGRMPSENPVLADREHTEAKAAIAVEALRASGHPARWSVAAGDPAHEIVEAARAFGSDLIVVGSRGNTGLDRLLLGSVARNVLLHTDCSVLIVREPIRVKAEEPLKARIALAAGAV